VELPATLPILQLEIVSFPLSDLQPEVPEGYKVCLVEDRGYTKLWMIYRVIG